MRSDHWDKDILAAKTPSRRKTSFNLNDISSLSQLGSCFHTFNHHLYTCISINIVVAKAVARVWAHDNISVVKSNGAGNVSSQMIRHVVNKSSLTRLCKPLYGNEAHTNTVVNPSLHMKTVCMLLIILATISFGFQITTTELESLNALSLPQNHQTLVTKMKICCKK